jgi:hypothetical protein
MRSLDVALVSLLTSSRISYAVGQDVLISRSSDHDFALGNGYSLRQSPDNVKIFHDEQEIWTADIPFISASGGRDIIVGSSGAFNITKVDEHKCQDQRISDVSLVDVDAAVDGKGVKLSGALQGCGNGSASYTATFWVPADLDNRIAFDVEVDPSTTAGLDVRRVYISFGSDANEDFYGLGAQGSFASLKNQSIPVFTREQGVGRGDQPVTDYLNE